MEEMVSKKNFFPSPTKSVNSSPNTSSLTTSTKTTEIPLNYRYLNFFNNSSSTNSSIKSTPTITTTPQSSPYKKEFNNNFSLKNSSIGSGRFSFFTPKFNPLRYKNGWLFRHLCEKPALKNPAIKNSPIKIEEEKNEGDDGGRINDSISSENNADLV